MKKALSILVAAAAAGVGAPSLAGDGPISMWFAAPPEEVAGLIVNMCAEHEAVVTEQDAYHVICSRQDNSLKGSLAQALIGNSYSTTPELKVRLSLVRQGANTKVIASQWIETVMAFGQVRTSPVTGVKQTAALRDALRSAGGDEVAPSTGAAFTKDNPLIIQTPAPLAPPTSAPKTPDSTPLRIP